MLTRRTRRSPRTRRFCQPESLENRSMMAVDLVITEINYAPYAPTTAELAINAAWTPSSFEFIELMNNETTPISLGGLSFNAGVTFTFPGNTMNPGEVGVIVRDQAAFQARYGSSARIIGVFTSGLTDDGEELYIVDLNVTPSERVTRFTFGSSGLWPKLARGNGTTLELIDPNTSNSLLSKWYSWRNSTEYGGSPGRVGVGAMGIVINEVLAHTDPPQYDSIELYNTTANPIDISGWYLSDALSSPRKFRIPNGTIIPASGYRTYSELDFNPTPLNPAPTHFGLNGAHGDNVYLTVANASGDGIRYFVDTVEFEASFNGVSFGRWPNGQGVAVPTQNPTFGAANSRPVVGPLIISEFNYRPARPSDAALAIDSEMNRDDLEFIEIYNPTNQSISLFEWDLDTDLVIDEDTSDYAFPSTLILAPSQTAVVVSFDPNDTTLRPNRDDAFRVHYGLPANFPLLGGFEGKLSDDGESFTLLTKDEPPREEPNFFPQIVADKVIYDDVTPWPIDADGGGLSLHRTGVNNYGGLASSWGALVPSPGTVTLAVTVLGDFSGNQITDADDIDILDKQVRDGNQDLIYDVNGDNVVNNDDRLAWITVAARTRPGDANLDGVVDGRDYHEWYSNYGETNNEWKSGDYTGDTNVDDADFEVWSPNRFLMGTRFSPRPLSTRTPRSAAAVQVPQPAADATTFLRLNTGELKARIRSSATTNISELHSEVTSHPRIGMRAVRATLDDSAQRRLHRQRTPYRTDELPAALSPELVDNAFATT